MDRENFHAYVEFIVEDDAGFDRLAEVTKALRSEKSDGFALDEDDWLPFFTDADRAEFWWPDEDEDEEWKRFWLSTPLPDRHSPEMPTPPWDFGSMIIAIMDGEYDLVGIRRLTPATARFEVAPFVNPYGGLGAIRALVRAYGHKITGFDDGTGFVGRDSQDPRWHRGMIPPFKQKERSIWDRLMGR